MFEILQNYFFSGVTGNVVYNVLKKFWQQRFRKDLEELYLDAFEEAVTYQQDHFKKYEGLNKLDREGVRQTLRANVASNLDQTSLSDLSEDQLVQRLAEALHNQAIPIIGGHNLSFEDYQQLLRNLIHQTNSILRRKITKNEEVFNQILLTEVQENKQQLEQICTFLDKKFNMNLIQLEAIKKDTSLIRDRVQRIEEASSSPSPPASNAELLEAIYQASAELRNYPNEIAGIHLERTEVNQIVQWVLNGGSESQVGMLLDQPGGGKTVVMRDILEELEEREVPTLAIKADNLSGIKTYADLVERLGLPDRIEECVRPLVATTNLVVVLLDQLDALSLTLSRDQATLDVIQSILSRLRSQDNVKIIASCRTFDLNNDPRLRTIKVDSKFQLQPLDEEQVNRVLHKLDVQPARLLPAHRNLLTTPLHLDIYARIVISGGKKYPPEGFRTLQVLYEELWQKLVVIAPPDFPPPKERIKAIYQLVDSMQNNRQTTAPEAILDDYPEAAKYLERQGILRREKGNWLFLHQTLYDYCYARRFVAQNRLSQEILNGTQGLFERSQMVQVLAYLREADEVIYHRELTKLLFADNLRPHLHLLLIGWFGSLPNPTDDELRIARRLIKIDKDQARFFDEIRESEDWFDRLNEDVLPSLLRINDEAQINRIIEYFWIIIKHRPDAVLDHLRPYLGQSDSWDDRIAFCLTGLKDWRCETALDVLCDLMERGKANDNQIGTYFYALSLSNPAGGCRILRVYLDRRLDHLLTKRQSQDGTADLPINRNWDQRLLGETPIEEIMEQAIQHYPAAIIEHLLPWFKQAALALTIIEPEDDSYPSDPIFAWNWYDLSKGSTFAMHIRKALSELAKTEPQAFRDEAEQLAQIETMAVQRVLVGAYLSNPQEYINDIFSYLMGDIRRLYIEDEDYTFRRLYAEAFKYADQKRRTTLESLILNLEPEWEKRNVQSYGLTQLEFLKMIDPKLLNQNTQRKVQELERKFPDFQPRPSQRRGKVLLIGSPIEQTAQTKMSDKDWLNAMRQYDDSGYKHPDNRGGVQELSSSFDQRVKEEPKRFYNLAQQFDETISPHYIIAAVSGLTASDAPAAWIFDLIRRFVSRFKDEFRRSICYTLEKRSEDGIPDDLLDLMSDWALNDPDPAAERWQISVGGNKQPLYGGDPHSQGINSNRGAAIISVCRCALKRAPPQVERVFQLLEKAVNDPSTAVRTCIIESLELLVNKDDPRSLSIFKQALEDHPRLLQSPLAHRFLYSTYYNHFSETRPFIETLLTSYLSL